MMARLQRRIAGDVAGGFTVTDNVEQIGPDLIRLHQRIQVKSRTSSRAAPDGIRGANIVSLFAMESTPDKQDPDWPRYPETILDFATVPKLMIDLREIPGDGKIAALKSVGLDQPFAILTAFDPHGENLTAGENEQRKHSLDERLLSSGYSFVQVDCCSPDRSHCECSVAVAMPQEKALDLARELQQVAIFWFDGKRFWILGALVETDPLMLPRSS
jgi:hypothetical protein